MPGQPTRTILPGVLVVLGLWLSGCMVGPDYQARDLSDWLDEAEATDAENPPAATIAPEELAQWWTVLDDSMLTTLVERALKQNRDLQAAQAAVRQARARLGIAMAGLLPHLSAGGDVSRGRSSGNVDLGPSVTSDHFLGQFDATWEIDVFGGTRRGVQAAEADLEAQQAGLQDTWVTLAGEVAEAYIALRTNQQRLAVTQSNLDLQQQTLDLLRSRRKAGLVDDLAVLQADYNLQRTQSLIPTLRGNVNLALHALAVLTGGVPGQVDGPLRNRKRIPAPERAVAVGIPANALRRRPDVRRAERRVAAQTARIGEATADLYPKFYLLGSVGLESVDGSDFFDGDSGVWGVGPRITWPIFHGGSIRQNIRAQTALQKQLVAQYEQTVLLAVKEVQDAVVSYGEQQHRRDALAKAVRSAREAVEVSQDQYKNGLVDFSNVLDAQRSLLEFQEQLMITEGQISTSLVRLYKALGGGWETMEADT